MKRRLKTIIVAIWLLGLVVWAAYGVRNLSTTSTTILAADAEVNDRGFEVQKIVDLGTLSAGQVRNFKVRVINRSPDECSIVGEKQSCECIQPLGLPVKIASGDSAYVAYTVTAPTPELDARQVAEFEFSSQLSTSTNDWLRPTTIRLKVASVSAAGEESTDHLEPMAMPEPVTMADQLH